MVSHWMWATITDGGPTLTQLWLKASCWYSLCYTSPPLSLQYVQPRWHWPNIYQPSDKVSACTLWTHRGQQKALSSVEWLMARVCDGKPVLKRHWVDVSCLLGIVLYTSWPLIPDHLAIQQTPGIHTMLFDCWPTVFDAGPTLKQHWVNDLCLLGICLELVSNVFVAFVIRWGGALWRISELPSQLIFSMSSGMFFFDCSFEYVVLTRSWLKQYGLNNNSELK